MLPRALHALVSKRLNQFPSVGIVGPRQAGKTTLARQFSDLYFDLEQEGDRVRLDLEWSSLMGGERLVIFDEAQCWPEVFQRLRGEIDRRRSRNGRFLILGSVSPSLMNHVGESLAGRIGLVELTPFCLPELPPENADTAWRCGGFPNGGALDPGGGMFPVWQESYLSQLIHQDLPAWGLPARPQQTRRLVRFAAAMHGKQLNASQLGQSLGVSYHTVQSYLDYLEGAFLIRLLRPYFANNFPKRLIKTPKLYWRDSGLLHYLLGLKDDGDLMSQPWVGESWEGWVIEQILAARSASGENPEAWYFRTSDGLECDLVIESGDEREVIEIKLSSAPTRDDFAKLDKIARLVKASRQVLISRVPDSGVVAEGPKWSVNISTYLSKIAPTCDPPPPRKKTPLPAAPQLYQLLADAASPLLDAKVLTKEQLLRRADLLERDLQSMAPTGFRLLPPRWISPDGEQGPHFRLVEYAFDTIDHDLNRSDDPLNPSGNVNAMTGSGLDRESLLYLSKASAIGHEVIPNLWPDSAGLQRGLSNGETHLDTLNEVWWLSRWHGIDPGSVDHEVQLRFDSETLANRKPPTVDWAFTALGGQIKLRLEIKNRRGSKASAIAQKPVRLFGDDPARPFFKSGPDEINVLAITAYHEGWITRAEERKLVTPFLNAHPAVDAVALAVLGGEGGHEALYFPDNRELEKKDLLLKALFKPPDPEDHARVGEILHPISIDEAITRARRDR